MSKVSSTAPKSAASKSHCAGKATSANKTSKTNCESKAPKTREPKKDEFKGSGELKEHCDKHSKCHKPEEKKGCDKTEKEEPSLKEQLDELKKEIEELKKAKAKECGGGGGGGGGCSGGGGSNAPKCAPQQAPAPMQQAQQTPGMNGNGDLDTQLQQLAIQAIASGQCQPQQAQQGPCQSGAPSGVQGIQAGANAFAVGFQVGFAAVSGKMPMGAAGHPSGGQAHPGQFLKKALVQKALQAKAQGFQPRPETRNLVANALGHDIFAQQQQQGGMGGFGLARAC